MAVIARYKGAHCHFNLSDDDGGSYDETITAIADTLDVNDESTLHVNEDMGSDSPDLDVTDGGVTVTITGDQAGPTYLALLKRRNARTRNNKHAPKIHLSFWVEGLNGGAKQTFQCTDGVVAPGRIFSSGARNANAKGTMTLRFAKFD